MQFVTKRRAITTLLGGSAVGFSLVAVILLDQGEGTIYA